MKNILIFAVIAGAVAAVAIYLTTENDGTSGSLNYIADAAEDEYDSASTDVSDIGTNTGRGFNALS
jgi:uncharacterized membrane-anchored protein YitT (DUF2179 family)